MSREIKFRVWDTDKKQFVPDNLFVIGNFGVYLIEMGKLVLMDNIVIQQYRGLKDKNGVVIYEGDILYFPNNKKTCKVVYYNGAFGVDYYYDSYPTHLFHWYDFVDTSHEKIIPEIIGNIYENPELLKQEIKK